MFRLIECSPQALGIGVRVWVRFRKKWLQVTWGFTELGYYAFLNSSDDEIPDLFVLHLMICVCVCSPGFFLRGTVRQVWARVSQVCSPRLGCHYGDCLVIHWDCYLGTSLRNGVEWAERGKTLSSREDTIHGPSCILLGSTRGSCTWVIRHFNFLKAKPKYTPSPNVNFLSKKSSWMATKVSWCILPYPTEMDQTWSIADHCL
jgi:hypothetical protein